MSKASTESELQWALLKAAPARIVDIRLFRRNVGTVRVGQRVMRFGIAGQCDIQGLWKRGVALELELKTATGRLSPEQRAWQAFCEAWSIPHMVLRGAVDETTEQTVERWLGEIDAARPF